MACRICRKSSLGEHVYRSSMMKMGLV